MHTDILIVGGGISGLLTAVMFDRLGCSTRIMGLEKEITTPLVRTVALFEKNISWLADLGVWDMVKNKSNSLEQIILADQKTCGGVFFDALEVNADNWAQHLRLRDLEFAIREFLAANSQTIFESSKVIESTNDPSKPWVIDDRKRKFSARMLCAADGRNSIIRSTVGIPLKSKSLDLSVMAGSLIYSNSQDWEKNKASTIEIYTNQELQTIIPLYDGSATLLWLGKGETIKRLVNANSDDLLQRLNRNLKDCKVGSENLFVGIQDRIMIPLNLYNARKFSAGRVVLLGEAGHGFPPIVAQGLNLTIRDLMTLEQLSLEGLKSGGHEQFIAWNYHRRRQMDVVSTVAKVGFMSQSITQPENSPIGLSRSLALSLLRQSSILRKFAINIFGDQ